MRRISSLPVAEFCGKADEVGVDIETTNALRSTIFHKFAETGIWPEDIKRLPEQDVEEIKRWSVPTPLHFFDGDKKLKLDYKDALKEIRVSLDKNFNFVELPEGIKPNDISGQFPNVLCSGTLDIGWDLPELDLVVISDIKSSIFAVKSRCKSLQLHGYGIGFAKKLGRSRYLVGVWDANDGRHYVDDAVVKLDSFEYEEYKARIKQASSHIGAGFVKGTHCSGCWKRDSCPAHLVDVPDSQFASLFNGTAKETDVRQALIAAKQLKDKYEKIKDICESWVNRHGPVRSEDGLKQWRPMLRSGKKSLDTKAVAAALSKDNLNEFMKEGQPFSVYDWHNRKDV